MSGWLGPCDGRLDDLKAGSSVLHGSDFTLNIKASFGVGHIVIPKRSIISKSAKIY